MFLKPFVADRWILVSSPSLDGEAVVARVQSRGSVVSGVLRGDEGGRRGWLGPGAGARRVTPGWAGNGDAGIRRAVPGPRRKWGGRCRVRAIRGWRWRRAEAALMRVGWMWAEVVAPAGGGGGWQRGSRTVWWQRRRSQAAVVARGKFRAAIQNQMFVGYTRYVRWLTDEYTATYIRQLTDEHTSLCTLVPGTFLGFSTEEYIRVIFLGTEEYIKIKKDTMFSCSFPLNQMNGA
jgi:hypothetical protein